MPGRHAHGNPRARLRGPAGCVALASAAAVGWVLLALGPSTPSTGDRPTVAARTDRVAALEVLRGWDRARAAAWARGDVRALRRLYTPGSVAGARDAAMLQEWSARGLRVRRMEVQVLAVDVRADTDRRLELVVTDRLARGVAVPAAGGPARLLPRDRVSTRRLEFYRTADRWVLAAAYPMPAATTAVTSGSENS